MSTRSIAWINTPVIMEALIRYKENRLPRSMKLWLEKLLDINEKESGGLSMDITHS